MKLLVVESPAKAKTIKKYLDNNFDVVASIGHFRDLPKSGIGIDEDNDFFVKDWSIDKKKVDPIIKSIKDSEEIFLALDPDREGELIAWHLVEICKEKKLTNGKSFKRLEFPAASLIRFFALFIAPSPSRKNSIISAGKFPELALWRSNTSSLITAPIEVMFVSEYSKVISFIDFSP